MVFRSVLFSICSQFCSQKIVGFLNLRSLGSGNCQIPPIRKRRIEKRLASKICYLRPLDFGGLVPGALR